MDQKALSSSGESILKLLQSDPDFVKCCQDEMDHGNPLAVIDLLKARKIAATPEDLTAALLDFSSANANPNGVPGTGATLRTAAAKQMLVLVEGFQNGLLGVVRQIDTGYQITMWMYTSAFVLGLMMMAGSLIAAFVHPGKSNLVLGGLGAADVITFLIFKPAQDLQTSRGNLAQLQAAFFAWINDIHNWNRYLDALEKESGKNSPPFDKSKEVSEIMVHNTERMVRLVGDYTKRLDSDFSAIKPQRRKSAAVFRRKRAADAGPNSHQ
jgi:hypothetical protein